MPIRYKKGYKYQLDADYSIKVDLPNAIYTEFIEVLTDDNGVMHLMILEGYAWDGPSGPALDTPNFMRGSLVHDALYQLMRQGHLDLSYRKYADELLRQICIENGMSRLRAWYVYNAVRWFAKSAAMDPREVITAP